MAWISYFDVLCAEMVKLQPNPSVSAACGQRVTLNCDVASSLDKVSIKHMEWSLNQRPLCSVDVHENVATHSGGGIKHFYCEYARGRLSLVLHEVRPTDTINLDFMCKLKSNRGAKHINTRVELQGQNHGFSSLKSAVNNTEFALLFFIHCQVIKLQALSIITPKKPVMVPSKS